MARSSPPVCRDCGALVGDERAHRRFHANVVTVEPQPSDRPALRFIGVPNPDPDPDPVRTQP